MSFCRRTRASSRVFQSSSWYLSLAASAQCESRQWRWSPSRGFGCFRSVKCLRLKTSFVACVASLPVSVGNFGEGGTTSSPSALEALAAAALDDAIWKLLASRFFISATSHCMSLFDDVMPAATSASTAAALDGGAAAFDKFFILTMRQGRHDRLDDGVSGRLKTMEFWFSFCFSVFS